MAEEQPIRILVVDDKRENLLALEAVLDGRGYSIVKADSGREALKAILDNDFALILLDIAMPDLNGYEIAELIRSRARSRHTPIIFITANNKSPAQVFRGYSVGAVDYLFKPFAPEVLLAKVDVFVDLFRKSRALERQTHALQRARDELELRVRERTAALARTNELLSAEIAERRRIEAERAQLFSREQAARLEAEAVNRTKDHFLATLSHELRTPLNAILGWSHILEATPPDPATLGRALKVIKNNAVIQRQLIDDILDVSRIVSGKMSLEITTIDPVAVIQAALDTVRPAAEAKNITIDAHLPDVGPMAGDRDRLQQVVWNLLSNAVKFTPKGGRVEVILERLASDMRITVRDNGQGIPPDFLPHVFDRFTQADSSTSRSHGGLGLGMAIVRHLVELHGGTVTAASEGINRGAVFTVLLPIREAAAGTGATTPAIRAVRERATRDVVATLTGIAVLVVDNEPDARDVAALMLGRHGARVVTAGSLPEALDLLRDGPPDVLVSDIGMPGQDGYELVRQIRELHGRSREIPAIAMTAYVSEQDVCRALASGFQRHVSKPVDEAELVNAVAELVTAARCTS